MSFPVLHVERGEGRVADGEEVFSVGALSGLGEVE